MIIIWVGLPVKGEANKRMGMMLYSGLLALVLAVSAPWWLWRMATSGRYRAGLASRLGRVPVELAKAVEEREVVWFHAVSVGEVLAAEALVRRMQDALPGWAIALSTTTLTGQTLARQKLAGLPVFYLPLDFAYAVKRCLKVLRPKLVVLVESELWPRLLHECERCGIPVVVANARVSDRSFSRAMRLRLLWRPVLGRVTAFLAQGTESAGRLLEMGAPAERVRIVGNLKYDVPPKAEDRIADALQKNLPANTPVLVCGSTLKGEELALMQAWSGFQKTKSSGMLILAPRHPQRFAEVTHMVGEHVLLISEWMKAPRPVDPGEVMLLDSLGSLAAIYQVATAAFIGGSLFNRGGHNPLEAARFGVPVVMGASYENFREIVDGMRAEAAISIASVEDLSAALDHALTEGKPMGERGRAFFNAQAGATERTITALLEVLSQAGRR